MENKKPAKIVLEGDLFTLVEESEEHETCNISAEICGINIWVWLEQHNFQKVKITLEEL